jgi:hypothetical protein
MPPLVPSCAPNWLRLAARHRPEHDWDDRSVSRFSHPEHPFKIIYLADGKETAFWEVFGADLEDMPVGNRALSRKAQLETRHWIHFAVSPGLRLIDVTREETLHALRANAGTWLAPYRHCQAWAKALMLHPLHLDGFIYQACRRGESARCLALFSRPDENTMEKLVRVRSGATVPSLMNDSELLRLLIRYNIDVR